MGNYILASDGELYHYGVLGMKWGVRRYQNKDGSLTEAGKRHLTNRITSRKTSTLDAEKMAKDAIRSDRVLAGWLDSDSYKNALQAKNDYIAAKEKYLTVEDKVWRETVTDVEKRYGKYADLERKGDVAGMTKFNNSYYTLLDKRFKETGVYELEKDKDVKYESLRNARTALQRDTQEFVSTYLGKYGNRSLKGQGSVVRTGKDIVDRLNVTDIFVEAYAQVDRIGKDWQYNHITSDKR